MSGGVDVVGLVQLQDRLTALPTVIGAALAEVMGIQAQALANAAGARLDSQVKGGSGTLSRALIPTLTVNGLAATAGVTVDDSSPAAAYAAFQEYGFHGTESVRAHLRTITQAFGRSIAPVSVPVQAYDRRVDYAGHPFLTSALADNADRIRAALADAIGTAAANQLNS
ncbi:hypothetical protein [Nitrospirillum amazonense]|uniref:Uncharacterized protein n=1 Tax=Nitrospirillum amazonense TaxID=28077 RepID=A0A560KH24_9PROT|nr:hypothetical protein [Nitrospirillum amazonense]MDG3443253.1 hypothetical protein [Nitrospirillum amazonense]TWB82608.1 hypothetical protein FBZ87_101316 [Nitrospirillum amazonense]